jgi:hypothetical protein
LVVVSVSEAVARMAVVVVIVAVVAVVVVVVAVLLVREYVRQFRNEASGSGRGALTSKRTIWYCRWNGSS